MFLAWCAETAILVLREPCRARGSGCAGSDQAGPHVILCYLECSGIPRQVRVHQNSGYLLSTVTGSQQPLHLTV